LVIFGGCCHAKDKSHARAKQALLSSNAKGNYESSPNHHTIRLPMGNIGAHRRL